MKPDVEVTNQNFIDLVRELFPNTSDEEALGILWNYTGYPGFWEGDPIDCCREQLLHLKDVGMEAVDAEFEAQMEQIENDNLMDWPA